MEKRSILAGAVITAAVLCNIVNQGFIGGTTGVLVEYFSRKSNVSESLLGWFGSVATATSLGMAPLGALIVKKIGLRLAAGIFSSIMIIGILSSAFGTEVWHVLLSYSVVASFGASCLQVCGVEAIRQHCGRYKHFGFTGQTAGIAIGHLVFPLVLRGMLLILSYRNSILYLTMVVSTCLISPAIYRPARPASLPAAHDDQQSPTSLLDIKKDNPAKSPCQRLVSTMQAVTRYPLVVYYLNTSAWNMAWAMILVFHYDYISDILAIRTSADTINSSRSPDDANLSAPGGLNFTNSDQMTIGTLAPNGIPDTASAGLAMTLVGTGQLLSTVTLSLIHAKVYINKYLVQMVAAFMLGSMSILLGVISTRTGLLIISCMYGMSGGLLISNVASLTHHLQGEKHHSITYGFSRMSSGIGALTGPPLAAALRREAAFSVYFSGAVMGFISFLALLMMVLCKPVVWKPVTELTDDNASPPKITSFKDQPRPSSSKSASQVTVETQCL